MTTASAGGRAKKQVSAEVRREQLVAAALRVMKKEGIAAATTRAICAEAGMPHGAFHYCFRSKRELYAALLSTDMNITFGEAWPTVVPTADPADSIRTLLRAYWSTVQEDPETQLVLSELVNLALREPELSELPRWEHRTYLEKVVSHIERYADEAHLELTVDVRALAEMVISALGGVVSSWLSHRDDAVALRTLDGFAAAFATLTRPRRAG
ncbi:TetR/AcrR family transcriptional regulator [Streptomyces hydrogenans]|uniref:TetR/AcrR family transcriptional regulator n=1 Tax=Streptomyces hydrogenans TaxID=1873719 RepID=UPI00362A6CAF